MDDFRETVLPLAPSAARRGHVSAGRVPVSDPHTARDSDPVTEVVRPVHRLGDRARRPFARCGFRPLTPPLLARPARPCLEPPCPVSDTVTEASRIAPAPSPRRQGESELLPDARLGFEPFELGLEAVERFVRAAAA